MKKVTNLIALAATIITACVIYLIFKGISLRTAPIIQPSVIAPNFENIAPSVVHRLFQDFQSADYVIWGASSQSTWSRQIIEQSAEEYQKIFHKKVNIKESADNYSLDEIKKCETPCWFIVADHVSHQLDEDSFTTQKIAHLEKNYFTITLLHLTRNEQVSQECDSQKRLNLNCLILVSEREVRRKMRDENKKYFFLRKYNNSDYFLFIE